MARSPRFFVEGVPSHVILRGNNRQAVFLTEGDRVFFHRCLAQLATESAVAVHAYVLMTNHVHLLATGALPASIPSLMQRLGTRYVGYFNYLHDRTGSLWQGRYKASLVEAERYFLTCQRYIELNPVRAGMVAHPGQHAWSSYRSHAEGVADAVVTPHELVERLGGDPARRSTAYRALFETDIDLETLTAIRDAVQHGLPLGSERFVASLEARGGRGLAKQLLGRPRRNLEFT
jgi:putative transposase